MTVSPRPRTDPIPGRAAALANADRVHSPLFWSATALEYVRAYASAHRTFMAEDVRVWATEQGLPVAPSERAWGAVMAKAVRHDYVRHLAMGKTEHSTGGWVAIWQSLICVNPDAPHVCPTCNRPLDTTGRSD